jgi:autotransporter-associated beta strand protein
MSLNRPAPEFPKSAAVVHGNPTSQTHFMKPRLSYFFPRTLMVCFAPLLACASVHGTVVSTHESKPVNRWELPPGPNLLSTATVTITETLSHRGEAVGTDPAILTDGSVGIEEGANQPTTVSPSNGTSFTYALDLSNRPEGYDITSFDSYSAWPNSGRDNQNYMLLYSTVADPGTFIRISTVELRTSSDRSAHTQLTDNTGFLAKGVHSIRLIFDRQENGFVGYSEFVLRDTPVVVCVDNAVSDNNNWPPLSGPNLLDGATATPPPSQPVHGGDVASDSWTTVTDGELGTTDVSGNAQSVTPNNNDTVTFPLDLVAKPEGYDITSFESYAAWGSNGRDDQRYTLQYSTVADPENFVTLTEVFNHTEYHASNNRRSTRTRVTANGGKLALGVAAIRLIFHDQENGYLGYREFILRDTPLPTNLVYEANSTNLWTLPSGTNLLNNTLEKTPAFAGGANHGNGDVTNEDWATLTDGSTGDAGRQRDAVSPLNGTSVVFPLDLSTNTKGYNITSLDTYAAWGDSGRDDQDYIVSYSTWDAPEVFIPIERVSNKTYMPFNATHTRLAANFGFLATNVGAVKFDFVNQENAYVGFREFIALGSAAPLADPLTWAGLTGPSWISGADHNWQENGVTKEYNPVAPLVFDNTGINTQITLPADLTAANMTFANDAAHPYSFAGAQLAVTNQVSLTGAGSVVFNNILQSAGLEVSGSGSLTLAVDNLLTGSSTVSNGTLHVMTDSGLGASALSQSGGTVNLSSASPVVDNLAGTGGVLLLGKTTGGGATELNVGTSISTTYGGSIGNASASSQGSLFKSGTGALTLSGTNTYTGTTTVFNGALKLSQRTALYNGEVSRWTPANLQVLSGSELSLRLGGVGEFTSADVVALQLGGFSSDTVLAFDTTSGNAEISHAVGGDVPLRKDGINTLKLTGANTFAGGITVAQGALEVSRAEGPAISSDLTIGNVTFDAYASVGADEQFAPGAVVRFDTGAGAVNGKFQLRGTHQTIAGLESPTYNRLAIVQNDELNIPGYTADPGPASLTINTAADSFYSFKGLIRNQNGASVTLVKTGLGTQELVNTGVSYSYDGPTLVNQGTLRFNFGEGGKTFSSNIEVAAPGTLEFHAVGGELNFDREISGEGHVLVNGVNAVRFTNNQNSWAGGTTVGYADDIYMGFLALVGNGEAGAGDAEGQQCAGGAMTPSNLITVENGATLALDGTEPLGKSTVLPQFACLQYHFGWRKNRGWRRSGY